jgi:hypothetical protein
MDTQHLLRKLVLTLTLLVLLAGTVACAEEVETGPRAWIDFPRDGASAPAGAPVTVISHAYARQGVGEVLLSVNGEAYRHDPPAEAGASFSQIEQEWLPEEEGVYTLQVVTYDTTGAVSHPDAITVRVGGEVAMELADTPTPTPTPETPPSITPTFTPTFTPTPSITLETPPSVTPTFTPTPTDTPTLTPTFTPIPPAEVIFEVDQTSLEQGQCTTLRWAVEHASAVYLNGQGVAGQGSQQVCPASTTTYTLRVEAAGGNVDRGVTVEVTAPPPPAQVNFQADDTSLEQGQCTTLRWDVEHATAVYLNGQGVVGHGSHEVCPDNTTTYSLHVEAPSGNVDRSVTIEVTIPLDTTPPPVPSPAVPANGLTLDCRFKQTLAWQPVSDPSGVVYFVKLERQFRKGQWQSVRGWGPVSGKQVEADVQCGLIYRWAVRAQDGADNISNWSGWSNFSVALE